VQCSKPVVEEGFVCGVSAKNVKTGENLEFAGKVVVDASGFMGVVRRKLPAAMGVESEVANEDVEACYREIRQLKQETEESKYCEIYLNQKVTPGGYMWIFPKGGARTNVGLGICMRGKFPNPRVQFYKHVLAKPIFEGSLLLTSGAWYDPTRRPFDSMVGNGIAVVGDAACLVNPIHGGGIGPSMLSGHLAGKAIVDAFGKGDVSREVLWPYNCRYMETYGGKQASLDAFRLFLIASRDDELNYGMSYKLLTEEDVLKAGLGDDFHLNVSETARRVFRGIRRLRFLNRLRVTVKLMKQIKAHYRNYPETVDGFAKWKKQNETLFKEAKAKLVA